MNLCSDNLSLSCRGCFNHQALQRKYVFDATLPPCVFTRHHHVPVILTPPDVSLSNTVTQSLARSLSLSIRQSAVSHSLIQSVPRLLSLSASRSFSHSVPLSLFAHLTSPLAHSPALSLHPSQCTSQCCQVFRCEQPTLGSFSLYRGNFSVL